MAVVRRLVLVVGSPLTLVLDPIQELTDKSGLCCEVKLTELDPFRGAVTHQELAGRVAFVTASGSGIGRAIAKTLAEHGAAVVVSDVNAETAKATAAAIRSHGGEASPVGADVADEGSVRRALDTALTLYGRLDIALNNAGIGSGGTVRTVDRAGWDRVVAVNLTGTFLCMRYELGMMLNGGGGTSTTLQYGDWSAVREMRHMPRPSMA